MEFKNGILTAKNLANKTVSIDDKLYTVGDKALDFIKYKKVGDLIDVGIENNKIVFVPQKKKPAQKQPDQYDRDVNIEVQSIFKELHHFIDLKNVDLTDPLECERLTDVTVRLYKIRKEAEKRC